jgi:hypothetical protein
MLWQQRKTAEQAKLDYMLDHFTPYTGDQAYTIAMEAPIEVVLNSGPDDIDEVTLMSVKNGVLYNEETLKPFPIGHSAEGGANNSMETGYLRKEAGKVVFINHIALGERNR